MPLGVAGLDVIVEEGAELFGAEELFDFFEGAAGVEELEGLGGGEGGLVAVRVVLVGDWTGVVGDLDGEVWGLGVGVGVVVWSV